ncbi:MAG: TonB-dependent receptor, partial [Sphingosinicella sp.]
HVGYGEGIAQPTFFDLFGFFPGTFVGNPFLVPEHSRGFEAGLGWRGEGLRFAATAFSHRLRDEVIETFDPATFTASATNASGTSRRAGLELEADVRLSEAFNLSVSYTFLDADEQRIQGSALVREVRRPRHGANLFLSGESGRFSWGAGMSYVGDRRDLDFDRFPAAMVILDDYWLGSARLSWEILPGVEIYGRVENVLDARYQDVVGYHPAGRTFHAGLRLVPGR